MRVDFFIPWALFSFAGCAPPVPQSAEQSADIPPGNGKALYAVSCAACHQINGGGLEGVAPPLAGTKWPNESVERLTRIVLHGLRGPITVAGQEYNQEMPAMGFFDDHEIAAILSHIQITWGIASPAPVNPETIRRIRFKTQHRSDSWTMPELSEIQ